MTRFITGNGIHTANMTSSASRTSSAPTFMPHVHALLSPLAFAILLAAALMLTKLLLRLLVQHPPAPAPAPRCAECGGPRVSANHERVMYSLLASGDAAARPAYWAVRDVLEVFEDDPVVFATRLEDAIACYVAGRAITDGEAGFARIVFVEGEGASENLAGDAGDDMGSEEEVDDAMTSGDTEREESLLSSPLSTVSSGGRSDDESRLVEAIRKTALPVRPLSSPGFVPYSGVENRGY